MLPYPKRIVRRGFGSPVRQEADGCPVKRQNSVVAVGLQLYTGSAQMDGIDSLCEDVGLLSQYLPFCEVPAQFPSLYSTLKHRAMTGMGTAAHYPC